MRKIATVIVLWFACGLIMAQTFGGAPLGGGGGGALDPEVTGLCVQSQAGAVASYNWLSLPEEADVASPGDTCGWADGQTIWFIGDPDGTYGYIYGYEGGSDPVMNGAGGRWIWTASSQVTWPDHEWQTDGVNGFSRFESDDDSQYLDMQLALKNADATSHSGVLYLDDNTQVTGTLTVDGTVIAKGGAELRGNVSVDVTNTYDLGANGDEFATLWVDTIDSGGTITVGNQLQIDENASGPSATDALLRVDNNSPAASEITAIFQAGSDNILVVGRDNSNVSRVRLPAAYLEMGSTDIRCDTDAACDIGASGTEFGIAWVQTLDNSGGTVDVAASLSVTGDIDYTGTLQIPLDQAPACATQGTDDGNTKLVTDANSSSYCVCMKDGASSVSWVQVATNGGGPPSC